ncbi:hypothetical protein [Lentilactobacillus kribbianus]|uniref:hypothetical protein n=1 Tax=Lentilactobacillus kribbianus TaxID=2729622 RepID=UPI0015535FFC|nr:hypothetical protein [Lentilactobacillus kribbianus]
MGSNRTILFIQIVIYIASLICIMMMEMTWSMYLMILGMLIGCVYSFIKAK